MGTIQKIERYAAEIDRKLRVDEQATDAMKVFTDSSLRRILKDCGYSKRGSRNVELIQEALVALHVYPDPPLTTLGLDWEQRIYFTRTPPSGRHDTRRVRFPAEGDLETFLVSNFSYLFSDLKLVDRQYRVQSGLIDILARDRDGYVVIELKLDRPTERIVSQLPRYMDDVSDWDVAKGGSGAVRGLVVASTIDEPMREKLTILAEAKERRIDWMTYQVELKLELAPSPVEESTPTYKSNGEWWTEAGIVNPQSPALAALFPYKPRPDQSTRRFDKYGNEIPVET